MSVLLLDHDGQGTHTIAQYLGELEIDADVYKSHQLSIDDIITLDPSHIILSPSEKNLEETIAIIQHLGPDRPMLGIGLGFIAVIQACYGTLESIPGFYAGQVHQVKHTGTRLFHGLPNPLAGVCYQHHSVTVDNLPKTLDVIAWTPSSSKLTDVIVAVKHQSWPLEAILFHPEAMLSEYGHKLLHNFVHK